MIPLLLAVGVGLAVAVKARRPRVAQAPPAPVARTKLRLVSPPTAKTNRRARLFNDLSRVALNDAAVADGSSREHLSRISRAWAEHARDESSPTDSVGRVELPKTETVTTGEKERVDNLPNAATLLGYGLGVWWCVGGPAWSALASIALDEVDGRLARATGEETSFGADLDFTSDVVLSGMALQRMNAPGWTIPASTLGSLAFRKHYGRPPFGSLRAAIMLAGVLKGGRR